MLKNLFTSKEFKKVYENKSSYEDLYEDHKLFETLDFSNKTGFSESLVGRAINSVFSFMKRKKHTATLVMYSRQLENEYLAAIFRTFLKAGVNTIEGLMKDEKETMEQAISTFKEAEKALTEKIQLFIKNKMFTKNDIYDINDIASDFSIAYGLFLLSGGDTTSFDYKTDIKIPEEYNLYNVDILKQKSDKIEDIYIKNVSSININETKPEDIKEMIDEPDFKVMKPNDQKALSWINLTLNRLYSCNHLDLFSTTKYESQNQQQVQQVQPQYNFIKKITEEFTKEISNLVVADQSAQNMYLLKCSRFIIEKSISKIISNTQYFNDDTNKEWLKSIYSNFRNTIKNKLKEYKDLKGDYKNIDELKKYVNDQFGFDVNYSDDKFKGIIEKIDDVINSQQNESLILEAKDIKVEGSKKQSKIAKKLFSKGNRLGEILGDSLPKSEFSNLNAALLSDKKVLEKFNGLRNVSPTPQEHASKNELNKIKIAEIQEAALLLYDNKSTFVNKRREGYEPNVRQNFTVKPRDREKLEKKWKTLIRNIGQLFQNYLTWKDVNPFSIYNGESAMFAKEDYTNPNVTNASGSMDVVDVDKNSDIISDVFHVTENANTKSMDSTYIIALDNYGVVGRLMSPTDDSQSIFGKKENICFLIEGFIDFKKLKEVKKGENPINFLSKYYYNDKYNSDNSENEFKIYASNYFKFGSNDFKDNIYVVFINKTSIDKNAGVGGQGSILIKINKTYQKAKVNKDEKDTIVINKDNIGVFSNGKYVTVDEYIKLISIGEKGNIFNFRSCPVYKTSPGDNDFTSPWDEEDLRRMIINSSSIYLKDALNGKKINAGDSYGYKPNK